uniref:Aerobic repressor AerR n=1 Tax=Rhodospirillum centenum TaxID=34018 RepID=B2NIL6_RHOCE|nr:aerobic repressor AerR [Rhodospirillum centenum]
MNDSVEWVAAGSAWPDAGSDADDRNLASKSADARYGDCDGNPVSLCGNAGSESFTRLILSQSSLTACCCQQACQRSTPGDVDVARFASLILENDIAAATAFIEDWLARGVSLDTIYLDLLAPTARHLGSLWDDDMCDFADVTVGLCRLQQVLRGLSTTFVGEADRPDPRRRILLVTVPGEQHSFGLLMVAEFFRRAGWDVTTAMPTSRDDLSTLVRSEWFALVGLSASCDSRLDTMAAAIRSVRRASRNRLVGILVGGPVFDGHPEYVTAVGADIMGRNGQEATVQAQNLLALMPAGC